MRKYAVVLAFLLVALGCGGSSDTATPAATVAPVATKAPTTTAIPTTTPAPTTVPLGACFEEILEEEIRKKTASGLVHIDGEPIDCSYQNLSNVDLSDHTHLPKVDFRGANLSGANLSGAGFSGANLRAANLSAANLAGVKFAGADLAGAILDGADLTRAILRGANLREASLRGANLSGAILDGAHLVRADLSGANLSGADFSGAALGGAILEEVCFDSSTSWSWLGAPPTNSCSSGLVAVDFWPVVDETTCVSSGTGVMRCLVGIGNYEGQAVDCLSLGVMGWRCIAYVPD